MKRLLFVLVLLALALPVYSYADDSETDGFISDDPSCIYIKPNPIMDLEIMADAGFASYRTDEAQTLDVYTNKTIEFDIHLDVCAKDMSNVFLVLSVYDVDTNSVTPELDKVYLNDHYLGNLTGNNDSWSFTTFPIDVKWLNCYEDETRGINKIRIEIDSLKASTFWVLCDWAAIKANVGFQVTSIDPHTSLEQEGHEIKIKFNEEIDEETLQDNLKLTYVDFNEVKDIRGKVEYDEEKKIATFKPLENLVYGVEYTVRVETGVISLEGKNLSSCRSTSFVPLPKLR